VPHVPGTGVVVTFDVFRNELLVGEESVENAFLSDQDGNDVVEKPVSIMRKILLNELKRPSLLTKIISFYRG
jgi:hypothetical protein